MSLPCKINPLGVYRLPAGYLSARFLETTGYQYIDTSVKLSNESEIKSVFRINDASATTAGRFLYGYETSTQLNRVGVMCLYVDTPNTIYMYFGGNGPMPRLANVTFSSVFDMTFIVTQTSASVEINGSSKAYNSDVLNIFEHAGGCTLGGKRNEAGGNVTSYFRGKIYSFSIARAGEKQCNYLPAIDAQGVPCMWDSVTMTPKYNAGTGDFIVGLTDVQARKLGKLPDGGGTLTISLPSEVVDENGVLQDPAIFTALSAAAAKGWSFILQTHDGTAVETAVPAGYMECEFLQSTETQYIDTGVTLTGESVVSFTYQNVNMNRHTDNGCIFGARESATARIFTYYDRYPQVSGNTYFGYNNLSLNIAVSLLSEVVTHVEIVGPSWRAVNSERTLQQDFEYGSFETYTAYLFTYHVANGADPRGYDGRIYTLTIGQPGTPQANYTPAVTPEGEPCMWDSVSTTAKMNAGTGAFIVGMTAAQAVQLANLPSGGGELTVSLPQSILNADGEITDAAVRAALNKAADNGWDITLQYYNEQ